jgi:hypothetical protein
MEDFRENSLREHVHLAVDARQQRLVSRIFASFAETIPGGKQIRLHRFWIFQGVEKVV